MWHMKGKVLEKMVLKDGWNMVKGSIYVAYTKGKVLKKKKSSLKKWAEICQGIHLGSTWRERFGEKWSSEWGGLLSGVPL